MGIEQQTRQASSLPCSLQAGGDRSKEARGEPARQREAVLEAIKKVEESEWTKRWLQRVREGVSEEVVLELSRTDERSSCQGKLGMVF